MVVRRDRRGQPEQLADVVHRRLSPIADQPTRQYSCTHGFGHAFMRMNGDCLAPALELCRELGPHAAPDCAQGAFHDYWFAVVDADDARLPERAVTDPRTRCAAQPAPFVRACWYRAFIDNRPAGLAVRSSTRHRGRLRGRSRAPAQGVHHGGFRHRIPDPALQLRICTGLTHGSDAESCIRGTKVQTCSATRLPRSSS